MATKPDGLGPPQPGSLLGIAVFAWLVGALGASIIADAVSAAVGWTPQLATGLGGPVGSLAGEATGGKVPRPVPLVWQMAFLLPMWAAFAAGAVAGARLDPTLRQRLRLRWAPRAIVMGAVIGVVTQLVVLWVLYEVLLRSIFDPDTVDDQARALTDQIGGWPDLVLLFVVIGLGAPLVEEVFFRGLVYRGFERVSSTTMAIVGSALVFAVAHLQSVQFAGLFVFGVILAATVARTGRLEMALGAHVAFNVSTVVLLGTSALG